MCSLLHSLKGIIHLGQWRRRVGDWGGFRTLIFIGYTPNTRGSRPGTTQHLVPFSFCEPNTFTAGFAAWGKAVAQYALRTYSSTPSCMYSLIRPSMHLFADLFMLSFVHSIIHSLIQYSGICSHRAEMRKIVQACAYVHAYPYKQHTCTKVVGRKRGHVHLNWSGRRDRPDVHASVVEHRLPRCLLRTYWTQTLNQTYTESFTKHVC